jgi:crotonobetainyl-CoA:carnitine CoA-transferase CaiB-like acyl-CoA transferase
MAGPLFGIRVLDLTRVLAGPFAGQVLADLGADVIKVERPGKGDDSRAWGPPFLKDDEGKDTSDSVYFQCCNRGKRSITVELTSRAGQELVRELCAKCDVLLENYKVGDLARYGLDFASLRQVNPRLVYCSITGYGQDGPYASRPGYDPMVQAIGGLMSVTGERDGPPQRVGVAVTDNITALYAVIAVQAALRHRDLTGSGQHIDLALLDVQIASMINVAQTYLCTGEVGQRNGNAHPSVMPSQSFQCSDGLVMIAAGNDQQFRKLCEALETPELAEDVRFRTNAGRLQHQSELTIRIESLTRVRSAQWVMKTLSELGVPCGRVNDIAQAFADPQVTHRGIRVEVSHPNGGSVPSVASPLRLSASPVRYDLPPPKLGAHTSEILQGILGKSDAEVAALRAAGAL